MLICDKTSKNLKFNFLHQADHWNQEPSLGLLDFKFNGDSLNCCKAFPLGLKLILGVERGLGSSVVQNSFELFGCFQFALNWE